MSVLRNVIISLFMVMVSGCITTPGYDEFFNAETNTNTSFSPVAPASVNVRVFKNDDEMTLAYWKARDEGSALVGQAAWEGPYSNPDQAKRRAASVGANLVLVSICYSHTRTGTMSLPQYHPGSSTRSSTYNSGTISGYGGRANYSGTSTTTAYSPGYTTYNNVPYSVERFHHWAVFLRTGDPSKSSISGSDVPLQIPDEIKLGIDEVHREILSNPSNPTNKSNHIIIGNAYMAHRHYPEAIVEYQAVLNMDPTNLHAMNMIGKAFLSQKNTTKLWCNITKCSA